MLSDAATSSAWAAALRGMAFVALPARAALFDDDEARRRIADTQVRLTQVQNQLEARLAAIEGQLKNQGLVDLFSQVEQLKTEFARLRGQIEVLIYEQDQAQKRQRDLYIDLDSRLRRLEGGPAVPAFRRLPAALPACRRRRVPGNAAPQSARTPPPAGRRASRRRRARRRRSSSAPTTLALDQFKAGNYPAAIASFNAFVKTYPKSPLAPSAYYWIGNSQFAQRDYRGAIATQRQLITAFPGNPKVPDALLNIATSQFELGDAAASRRTLEELIAKHAQSDAAVKAKQRLAIR